VFTHFHKPPYTYPYGRSVDETTTIINYTPAISPLGARVRMNCSKLSALTTHGRFSGISLDLLLFLELVYWGPQHHIYIWIWIWFELPLKVLKVLSPPMMGVVVSPMMVDGFICLVCRYEAGRPSMMSPRPDFTAVANF
jgi:hypothetical protein